MRITITVTRFINGRIDLRINYTALHKLARRSRGNLSPVDQLIDLDRRRRRLCTRFAHSRDYAIAVFNAFQGTRRVV